MKITQSDRDELLSMFKAFFRDNTEFDSLGEVVCHYHVVGIGEKPQVRALFDCLYALPGPVRDAWMSRVYTYANDNHIYSALKWRQNQD